MVKNNPSFAGAKKELNYWGVDFFGGEKWVFEFAAI